MTTTRTTIVLAAVLHLLKPVARLLLRHGVAYPAFAAALKQVFLEAAHEELDAAGRKRTDSAVSLLSGVHRRDVRTLGRLAPVNRQLEREAPGNVASQVVGRWLSDPHYLDESGQPSPLRRYGEAPSFDSLVVATSSEYRARAVLAELERLGIAEMTDSIVHLREAGFVPRQGFDETVALLRDNLHDHLAAAAENLDGKHNYLEQAVFVDEITEESARHLHAVSARAWRQAFRTVMREAQARYDHDQATAQAEARVHRARFGSYFYTGKDDAPNP
jgi:hypothetical protein